MRPDVFDLPEPSIADHGHSLERFEPSLAGPLILTGRAEIGPDGWKCWRLAGAFVTGDKIRRTLPTKDDAILWLKAVNPQ